MLHDAAVLREGPVVMLLGDAAVSAAAMHCMHCTVWQTQPKVLYCWCSNRWWQHCIAALHSFCTAAPPLPLHTEWLQASAYYRLGVGMHMICRAATELTKMAAALACGKSTQCVYEAVATKSKQFAARNSEMMSFQLAAMWHETYCGQVRKYYTALGESIELGLGLSCRSWASQTGI